MRSSFSGDMTTLRAREANSCAIYTGGNGATRRYVSLPRCGESGASRRSAALTRILDEHHEGIDRLRTHEATGGADRSRSILSHPCEDSSASTRTRGYEGTRMRGCEDSSASQQLQRIPPST